MAFEHKEKSGSLFKNQDKKSDKAPDYTGSIKINGELFRLAGWVTEGRRGTFLSLKASVPGERGERQPYRNPQTGDDVPF